MAYPRKLLSEGEDVVLETRTHWKALVVPVLELLVVLGVTGFLLAYFDDRPTWVTWTIVVVAAVLVLATFVLPFLRWRTTVFVVTTQRVITRQGILTKSGRDIPHSRINDVGFSHGLLDRLLRCGTLTVESAGERGQVVLSDIPDVEQVHKRLYELSQQASREP
jgi:membrane protein YdbS with pleckstrin-like domain